MADSVVSRFPWTWLKRIGYGFGLLVAFALGRFTDLITILDYFDKPKVECSFAHSPGYLATPEVPFAYVLPLALGAIPGKVLSGGTYIRVEGDDTLTLAVSPTRIFEVGWLNRGKRAAQDITVTVRTGGGTLCCSRPRPPEPLSPVNVTEETASKIIVEQSRLYKDDPAAFTFTLIEPPVVTPDTLSEGGVSFAQPIPVAIDLTYEDRRVPCMRSGELDQP